MERKLKVFAQPSRLSETVANITLVVFYSFFIYRFSVHYIETHRVSSLLYVFVESMFVIIAFTRRKPSQISTSFTTWVISLFRRAFTFTGLTNRDQRLFCASGITIRVGFASRLWDSIP